MKHISASRRRFISSSALGLVGLAASGKIHATSNEGKKMFAPGAEPLFYRYPSMSDTMVSAVVGAAHTDLGKVKELVSRRSELANATWDWGFGDWESALGAASHMGRKDIAEFLMEHGARPDIFTMAMMGSYDGVRNMVEMMPGVQSKPGPHGITLLQHAKSRLRFNDLAEDDRKNINKTVSYLESLGNADLKAKNLDISEEEQKQYIGQYRFGDGAEEIFEVNLNSRKILQIARKGNFGRMLNKTGEHEFSPGGAPSVQIRFSIKNGKAVSMTIHEPEPSVTASRI